MNPQGVPSGRCTRACLGSDSSEDDFNCVAGRFQEGPRDEDLMNRCSKSRTLRRVVMIVKQIVLVDET
jgi:hypothetical protein